MNISPCERKLGQMLQAVRQSLTWMPETNARFPVSVSSYSERCAQICLAPSQNLNVWRPNISVFFRLNLFSRYVSTIGSRRRVSQLAGVRGCHQKRLLSFLNNVFLLMWRRPQLAISVESEPLSPANFTSQDRFALRQLLWPDFST